MKLVKLRPHPQFIEIPSDDSLFKVGRFSEQMFTAGLEHMTDLDAPLKDFGQDAHSIMENKYVEFNIGEVPTLSMCILANTARALGMVVAPLAWPVMCGMDPTFQFGAIVFAASQIVDYYNDKTESREMGERARALESEFLRNVPEEVLNQYQKDILQEYPNGYSSLSYTRKPVGMVN